MPETTHFDKSRHMKHLQVWPPIWISGSGMRRTMAMAGAALTIMTLSTDSATWAQQPQSAVPAPDVVATFKSSVDVVRVSAFVRDRKGRFVTDLREADFEVFENGRRRAITDFRHEFANLSVALLFDISGSME